MSIPMQWTANVKLPYYGWFGRDGFSTNLPSRPEVKADGFETKVRDMNTTVSPVMSSSN